MNDREMPPSNVAEYYFTTCATEGKTPSPMRDYRGKVRMTALW